MSDDYENLIQLELEKEVWIDADGNITDWDTEDEYLNDPDLVAIADGEQYDEYVVVDWKADPADVMDAVNRALRLKLGIDDLFVHIDHGDDAYHFGIKR